MTTQMQQYLEATQRVDDQLTQLVEAEQEKRVALLDHNMEHLSEILRNQQAQVMKLEGFEKKRVQAQEEAGFEGLTSAQILPRLTGEERTAAQELFEHLSRTTQELRELNQVAVDIAQSELRMIDQIQRAAPPQTSGLYTYGGKKDAGRGSGAAFEEKI